MPDSASITQWVALLGEEDSEAALQVWQHFYVDTVAAARRTFGASRPRGFDEEDVALSALNSFMDGVAQGRFPNLSNRRNLWSLILTITVRKSKDKRNSEYAQRRSPASPQINDPDVVAQVKSKEMTPAFLAEARENVRMMLEQLSDSQREVAILKLDGYSNDEISTYTGLSVATVERRLKGIREIWTASMVT